MAVRTPATMRCWDVIDVGWTQGNKRWILGRGVVETRTAFSMRSDYIVVR